MSSIELREVVNSEVVNENNRGAILTVTAAFGICCVFVILAVRLIIRRPLRSLFGWDDFVAVIATVYHAHETVRAVDADKQQVLALAHSIVTIYAVDCGLGTRIGELSAADIERVDKVTAASA
jgi:hypothetical protein